MRCVSATVSHVSAVRLLGLRLRAGSAAALATALEGAKLLVRVFVGNVVVSDSVLALGSLGVRARMTMARAGGVVVFLRVELAGNISLVGAFRASAVMLLREMDGDVDWDEAIDRLRVFGSRGEDIIHIGNVAHLALQEFLADRGMSLTEFLEIHGGFGIRVA